jgi:hypothetical protein|tara:strand:- start:64 stop:195 length:132 start_codon:yes stop_codon:yes gene_type:complete
MNEEVEEYIEDEKWLRKLCTQIKEKKGDSITPRLLSISVSLTS